MLTRWTRRRALTGAVLSVVMIAIFLATGCGETRPARPNIVLVVLDTVRRDATGCGETRSYTPHLDGLMAEGTGFTDAWSAAPWTPPSHASMFTGLLPSGHNCTGRNPVFSIEHPTLAERLRESGYETAAFHSNPWLTDELTGLLRGFDTRFVEADYTMSIFGESAQGGPETAGNICRWLDDRDDDRPFFMFVNILEAHLPYDPPAEHRTGELADLPPDDRVETHWANEVNAGLHRGEDIDWERVRRLYAGDVSMADGLLGVVLKKLRSLGVYDETVIIVTSDHGENLGDHGYLDHQFGVFESLLGVPLVIRAPGRLEVGVRHDPVVLTDLCPTILDVAGIHDASPTEHSRSLLQTPAHSDRPLVAEYAGPPDILLSHMIDINPRVNLEILGAAHATVRVGSLRLTVSSDGSLSLVDTSQDPDARENLAGRHKDKVTTMTRLIPSLDFEGDGGPEIDEEMAEWLRSLGYM